MVRGFKFSLSALGFGPWSFGLRSLGFIFGFNAWGLRFGL